jgi:hypothetical protein
MKFKLGTFAIGILLLLSIIVTCTQKPANDLDLSAFINPPPSVQVNTWWHWLDGAVTKEGITKDLEAMKEQGISQATILNIGLFGKQDLGVSRVVFNSAQWHELFLWALQEADRLGIKIGAHNCDGWSSSGGPWITPEYSMKQYVWSKLTLSGGKSISINLTQPPTFQNYYKDIAVVAFSSPSPMNSFQSSVPVVKFNGVETTDLCDGNPLTSKICKVGDKILISFGKPFQAGKIVVHPRKTFMWSDMNAFQSEYLLSVSTNGRNFTPVKKFTIKGLNQSISIDIPITNARYYELSLTSAKDENAYIPFSLAEVELLNKDEQALFAPSVSNFLAKTVFVKSNRISDFDVTMDTVEGKAHHSEVIDLTSHLSANGVLNWDAPAGNWVVLRFGYTSTGAMNGPATDEGRGLECDKMDTAALNLHFRSSPEKLIQTAGKFAGNTFKFILIDSWECGFQNWTASFPQEFSKRRGYDILQWIPALCGENIDNTTNTEAFLYDFRHTISELIDQNYYLHFRNLCHDHSIEMHAEPIYGGPGYPPLDVMKANSYPDLNMWEFWAGHNYKTSIPEYTASSEPTLDFPALSSTAYNKPVLGAESYTAQAHYSESPWDLKPFGDRAFCSGVNQFILHSYVHQPTDRKPGMTLLRWGSHFNRNNLYWNHISDWLKYHARIQSVLRKGITSTTILAYTGDQLPQAMEVVKAYPLPFGFAYAACNTEILGKLTVRNRKLVLPNGAEYSLLTIPPSGSMQLSTLKLLENLVKQGAMIYGPKPESILSYSNRDSDGKELKKIADQMWGTAEVNAALENTYGKGLVCWGTPIARLVKKLEIAPDFSTGQPDSLNLMYIHKKLAEGDVFFVFNQQDKQFDRECTFDADGVVPEIWDPEEGKIILPGLYDYNGKRIRIPLHFAARQSYIVVLRKGKAVDHYTRVSKDGKQLFPVLKNESMESVPHVTVSGGKLIVCSGLSGRYTFTAHGGSTMVVEARGTSIFPITEFNGELEFTASYPINIPVEKINKLSSWTESENSAIRYFSGIGNYKISFSVTEEFLKTQDSIWLNLGEIGSTAEVILNGSKLRYVWKPGKMLNVTGIIKGSNSLEVKVANVYRNRIIGDYREAGEIKTVWTPAPVEEYLDKGKDLKRSGLLGPLVLYGEKFQ